MSRWRILTVMCLLTCLCGCQQAPSPFISDLSGPAVPWTSRQFCQGGRDFHFAIMSDRNGGARPGVFEGAVTKLDLLQPEFVICVGDLIGGYTKDPAELARQQDELDGIVGRLEMPFFHVPGNHDISDDAAAAAWETRYGRCYYHFLYKGALFLCLCTEGPPAKKLLDEQVAYVRKVLESNKTARWTFLFLHNPIFVEEPGKAKNPFWAKIEPLLAGRKHTIFAGHWHEYAIYQRDGNKYINLATTGGDSGLLGVEFGSFDHVVWVTVRDEGPRIANLMLDGIQDENVSTPERTRQSYQLLAGVKLTADPAFAAPGPVKPVQTKMTFTNTTDVPATVTAMFQPSDKLIPSPPSVALQLPPKSDKAVDLLLKPAAELALADVKPLTLVYSVSYQMPDGNSRKFDFSHRIGLAEVLPLRWAARPVIVDGQLDDWPELTEVRQPGQIAGDVEGYHGANDCRFRFGITYDEENLYVAVDVTDDNVLLDPNKPPDDQDAALILLGADPEIAMGSGGDPRTYGILMCPRAEPTKPNVDTRDKKLRGTKRASIRTAGGYTAELSVPLSQLNDLVGRPWQDIRLNVAVMDCDAPGKTTQLYWQADWWSPQATYGSGTFRKEPPPSSKPASSQASPATQPSR